MYGLSENFTVNDLVYYKYAPNNSGDVERSCPMFKALLADNLLLLFLKKL